MTEERKSWLRRNRGFLAWVVMGIFVAYALIAIQVLKSEQIDQVCEGNAQTRQATLDLINGYLGADAPISPDDPPDAVTRLEKSNKNKDDARALANATLQPAVCDDGVPPVPHVPVVSSTTSTTGG